MLPCIFVALEPLPNSLRSDVTGGVLSRDSCIAISAGAPSSKCKPHRRIPGNGIQRWVQVRSPRGSIPMPGAAIDQRPPTRNESVGFDPVDPSRSNRRSGVLA